MINFLRKLFGLVPPMKSSDCSYCYFTKYESKCGNPDIKIRKHMKGHGVCEDCYYALR